MQAIKNFATFSLKLIFFILVSLKKLWESISNYIYFALLIINPKVILREFVGLINLSRAQTLYIYEIIEVIVICKDEILILIVFQVIISSFEYFNNS